MFCRFLLLFLVIFPLSAQSSYTESWQRLADAGVGENYEIREKHRSLIMARSFEAVDSPKRIYVQDETSRRVRFEVRKTSRSYYLLFLNEYEDRFPLWSSGSWVIKKDLNTGETLQAKIFLFNDETSYIRLFPDQGRSRMDLYLYDMPVYQKIRIPVAFEKLLFYPLSRVVDLTENKVQWDSILTNVSWSEWEHMAALSQSFINKLHTLGDEEDGAMDEEGNFVYIETGELQKGPGGFNCSGFVKWIVDDLYKKETGHLMDIEVLKTKHYDLRGTSWSARAEEARDPYFGLDWTRNIAHLYKQTLYPEMSLDPESLDLRDIDFFEYIEDVGYSVSSLKTVLFLAAVKNPGKFYLGSVNKLFGKAPVMRQHTHVVALFPYFDKKGIFKVDVIERQALTGLESLKRIAGNDFIHLVKIDHN